MAVCQPDDALTVLCLLQLANASEFAPLLECAEGKLRLCDAFVRKLAAFDICKPTVRFVVLAISSCGEVTVMLRSVREMCDCFAGSRLAVRVRAVAVQADENVNVVPVMVVCAGSTTESFVFLLPASTPSEF